MCDVDDGREVKRKAPFRPSTVSASRGLGSGLERRVPPVGGRGGPGEGGGKEAREEVDVSQMKTDSATCSGDGRRIKGKLAKASDGHRAPEAGRAMKEEEEEGEEKKVVRVVVVRRGGGRGGDWLGPTDSVRRHGW